MPETMGVMAGIEAPLRRGHGRCLGRLHGALYPLAGRGTDHHLRDVLEFPGQAFRAKPWLGFDEMAGFLLHLGREAPGGPTGGRPFGEARQLVAVAQTLNRAGRRRFRPGLGVDLRRTSGRITWRQGDEGLFLGGRQPIGGALRPRVVIREGTLERGERAVAPFI